MLNAGQSIVGLIIGAQTNAGASGINYSHKGKRMSDLKQCPCGGVPEQLELQEGDTFRWLIASPSCCDEWLIEFKHNSTRDNMNEAVKAWNNLPRFWEQENE